MCKFLHKPKIAQFKRAKAKVEKKEEKKAAQDDQVDILPEPARLCIRKKTRDSTQRCEGLQCNFGEVVP